MHTYQAVLLIGGASTDLFPLTAAGTPKVLLPVANEALLSFSLRTLEQAAIQDVLLVCAGDSVATKATAWLGKKYQGKLQLQVKSVPEDRGTADALRQISDILTADSIIIASGDTVTDVNLRAVIATHYHHEATVTALLSHRSSLASAETKPGKAPKGVDYIGLDAAHKRILYLDSSRVDRREVRIPTRVLQAAQHVELGTHLSDQHLYIIDRREALSVLQSKPAFSSIQKDLIPYLVRHQQSAGPKPGAALMVRTSSEGLGSRGSAGQEEALRVLAAAGGGLSANTLAELSHSPQPHRGQSWLCQAFIAPKDSYCIRARSLAAYGDAHRDLMMPEKALTFLGKAPDERTGAITAEGVLLGHKALVGGACLVGARTRLGERTSVKRSVVGAGCVLGPNAKVDKCVIMDGADVGEGTQLINCIICTGAQIGDRCTLRDCQVAADFTVAEGSDYRGQVLAKGKRPDLAHLSSAM